MYIKSSVLLWTRRSGDRKTNFCEFVSRFNREPMKDEEVHCFNLWMIKTNNKETKSRTANANAKETDGDSQWLLVGGVVISELTSDLLIQCTFEWHAVIKSQFPMTHFPFIGRPLSLVIGIILEIRGIRVDSIYNPSLCCDQANRSNWYICKQMGIYSKLDAKSK